MARAYARRQQYHAKLVAGEVAEVVAAMLGAATHDQPARATKSPRSSYQRRDKPKTIAAHEMLKLLGITPPRRASSS